MTAATATDAAPQRGDCRSQDLIELVRPILEELAHRRELNQQAIERTLGVAMLAWNAASFRAQSVLAFMRDFKDQLAPELLILAGLTDVADLAFERRKSLFPDDRRVVAEFNVRRRKSNPDELRISVVWGRSRKGRF